MHRKIGCYGCRRAYVLVTWDFRTLQVRCYWKLVELFVLTWCLMLVEVRIRYRPTAFCIDSVLPVVSPHETRCLGRINLPFLFLFLQLVILA